MSDIYTRAQRWAQQADARHWNQAWLASKLRSRRDVLKFAEAINRREDTVRNLSDAYQFFSVLVSEAWKHKKNSEPIRKLRRQYPYTRWAIVSRAWRMYEFGIDEAVDWLSNFEGGNDAMSAEIENKHGAPEWERRANGLYRMARKLRDDFGTPDRLHSAAVMFVEEFEKWENEVTK